MNKTIMAIMLIIVMLANPCKAEGRNIIEFCQLYMNRVDTCYDAMNGVYLDFDISEIKSAVLSSEDNFMTLSCLAGKAVIDIENMEIVELSMTPLQGSITDEVHDIWALKNSIAISALEYDSYEQQSIIQEGEYMSAVEKAVAIWNEYFRTDGISKAVSEKKDVLVFSGDSYDYWAHYGYYPNEYACYIARKRGITTNSQINTTDGVKNQSVLESFKMAAGRYTVGEDIPAGIYRCECKGAYSSAILKVYTDKNAAWPTVNEIMAELYGSSIVGKLELDRGNIVEISMGSIEFSPYTGQKE